MLGWVLRIRSRSSRSRTNHGRASSAVGVTGGIVMSPRRRTPPRGGGGAAGGGGRARGGRPGARDRLPDLSEVRPDLVAGSRHVPENREGAGGARGQEAGEGRLFARVSPPHSRAGPRGAADRR